MGIFSFLSRKSGNKGGPSGPFKSQAYSATSGGTLPVRGTYPVAGNGPNSLKTLSITRTQLREIKPFDRNSSCMIDEAAPAPGVPRYREDEELKDVGKRAVRPRTAPNGSQPPVLDWAGFSSRPSRCATRGPPPVSFRRRRAESVAAIPRRTAPSGTDPVVAEAPMASFAHSRCNSLGSTTSRRFKDILDAQSEFKPSDFRTRVKASGVRDYGEDVADRNLGANGFNLESPQVQEFYAASPDTSFGTFGRPATSHKSFEPQARVRSLSSSVYYPTIMPSALRARSSSPDLLPGDICEPSDWRVPSRDHSASRRTKSLQRKGYPRDIPHLVPTRSGLDGLACEFPPPGLGLDMDSSEVDDGQPSSPVETFESPPGSSPIVWSSSISSRSSVPPQSRKALRDSVYVAKEKMGTFSPDLILDYQSPESTPFRGRKLTPMPASRSQRGSVVDSFSFTPPGKQHSLRAFHSSVASSASSRDSVLAFNPLAYPPEKFATARTAKKAEQRPGRSISVGTVADFATPTDAIVNRVPLPYSSAEKRPSTGESHTRARSLMSAAEIRRSDETSDVIYSQSSNSIRKWSLSSTTQIPSDAGSSFPRPYSHTTPNTSVDLSNPSSHGSPMETRSRRSTSLSSNSTAVSPTLLKMPTELGDSNFNIDDYISSDSDSDAFDATAPRRPRGEGEEELLFRDDGYGLEAQLPGLFESVTSAAPSPNVNVNRTEHGLLHRPHSTPSLSLSASAISQQKGYRHNNNGGGQRYILNTGAHSDYSDDDEDQQTSDAEGGWDDGMETLAPPRQQDAHMQRRPRSAHASTQQSHYRQHHQDRQHQQPFPPYHGKWGTYAYLGGHGNSHAHAQAHHHHHHHPCSDFGVDVIQEEQERSKIDISAAVRLRKEVKARERAQGIMAGSGSRRRKARRAQPLAAKASKAVLVPPSGSKENQDTDEADLADVDEV